MSVENKQTIEDRIYIGNVDFKASEEDLKQFFQDFEVVEVNIPSKVKTFGSKTITKHLGFAFVQFKHKADADKAIEQFNGKEFKNRKIYVKKAVPEPTEEEKQKKNELFKLKKAEQAAKAKASRKAKAVKKKAETSQAEKSDSASEPAAAADTNGSTASVSTSGATENDSKVPKGEPSKDTIFITNLDYKVNHKVLIGLFKEYKPKWIHVPTRRVSAHIYRRQKALGRPIFNKGIAFVKFNDEEAQQKAIAEFNGTEINGRNIIVDVAVDGRVPKDEEVAEQKLPVPEESV